MKVEVGLGDRAYDILIGPGLLAGAGTEIASRLPGTRAAIITDENVAAAHLETLKTGLGKGGIQAAVITLPAGEKTKSFTHLEEVVDGVLAAKLERRDVVVALGGGVIGDLAGFAAGI
ncbi:iron-containing alcohol dehydrogenase, partial [bacterium M00.F.Ca.ET.159.01.1.1]